MPDFKFKDASQLTFTKPTFGDFQNLHIFDPSTLGTFIRNGMLIGTHLSIA
jgi:hypothetical protein